MNHMPRINRRAFVVGSAAATGGFALGFHAPMGAAAQDKTPEINAWVVVKPDDTIVLRIPRAEMGQGTLTGLAQMIAEELECDWSKVTTEIPSPAENVARKRVWGNFNATGSRGIRESENYVRKGGATARQMLLQAAANEWKVPVGEVTVANGVISHKSGKKTTYGKVAAAAAKIEPPKDVPLKDPKNWRLIGKPMKRLDTVDKLTGKYQYGIDFRMPGMLYAAIRDCPVNGGKVASYDAARAEQMPGVKKIVQVGATGVAAVADSWWQARNAIAAVSIVWDEGAGGKVSSADISAMMAEGLTAEQAFVGNKAGDAKATLASATKKVEATYSYPYQNHAPLEPMNATAVWTNDRCDVYCGTQNSEAALASVIAASGHPVTKCDVHRTGLGGGFGRRARNDYIIQAVQIAKQMPGTPVKLVWSREEDMTHCAFHPATHCKLSASLDDKGNLSGMHMRISGHSIIASLMPDRLENGMDPAVFQGLTADSPEGMFGYNVPNLLVDHAMRNSHLTAGFWRGVNANHNAIYVECFIDEVAKAAGVDPLEFRRRHLRPKHLAVMNAAAAKANYGKAPKGIYQGVAQIHTFGSYVAAVADVSVTDGRLKVHRIVAATDPGYAVNPAQIERQVMGSFVYGLTAMLYGEITVKNGAVEQTNFDTYPMMRMDEMPKIEVVIVPSGGFWGGVGEPTIAVAAPAVLNAIYAATGKRVRNFPLMNTDLRKA